MNWFTFDEKVPQEGQLVVASNCEGGKQFWLWQGVLDEEQTLKSLGLNLWCPLPPLPKPPDPFLEHWTKESHCYSAYPSREAEARAHFNAGREYERKMK